MPPRFFVLRHGRSVANEQRVIASRPASAAEAYGLTQAGHEQVARTVEDARTRGALLSPLVLLCSPLLRARQSADVAGTILGARPVVEDRLAERDFGDFELAPDSAYERVWAADRADPTHRRWGVESITQVLRRASEVVRELAQERVATVLLCTHGDVASVLLCASHGKALKLHREVGGLSTGALAELGPEELVADPTDEL
jgi:broad specificity phosphatase PhoE